MRFRVALLIGSAMIVAGVVVLIPSDDGDITAGSTSTTTTEAGRTTTTAETEETTTTSATGDTTTTTEDGQTTTSATGDSTTTTESDDTTTTTAETTTTTAGGPDDAGPTISDLVISEEDLTEWCDGDPEANATMTISLQANDPSGVEAVFVSWLVDLTDGVEDFVRDGDTWEVEVLFESGTIYDIIEPQPIDMVIVAEDGVGNFTFVDRFGPMLIPQECS